jgi:hypothetical protein
MRDNVFGRYSTPLFKQSSERRLELVLKALAVPWQLRRASHVLLWKPFLLLGLGHHNVCVLLDCKDNVMINTIDSRSQLLADFVFSWRIRPEANRYSPGI